RIDGTSKGKRISEIGDSGFVVVTTVLADDLTEAQALKLEAELIAAFGTQSTGGMLANSVIPSGNAPIARSGVSVPAGAVEKAQVALDLLKD
ncbi:hypothetical protein NQU49_25835, partial [Escherichia coli]|uniref:hypothetical protein n=1 Tax=Escherichia coli TaxID=562 RepID=UPI0021194D41